MIKQGERVLYEKLSLTDRVKNGRGKILIHKILVTEWHYHSPFPKCTMQLASNDWNKKTNGAHIVRHPSLNARPIRGAPNLPAGGNGLATSHTYNIPSNRCLKTIPYPIAHQTRAKFNQTVSAVFSTRNLCRTVLETRHQAMEHQPKNAKSS